MFKRIINLIQRNDTPIYIGLLAVHIETSVEKYMKPISANDFSLNDKIQIKNKLNLDKIVIIKHNNTENGALSGNTIIVNKNMYDNDIDATIFILKHELSHHLNNEVITNMIYPTLLSIGTFCLAKYIRKPALLKSLSIYFTSLFGMANYNEKRADDFAIKTSTIEELFGGRRYMKAEYNHLMKAKKSSLYYSLMITNKGRILYDVHPSSYSRINKIEHELMKRNIGDIAKHDLSYKIMLLGKDSLYETTISY